MTGYGRSGGGFMIIGVPREVRPSEYRVGLTPAGTDALLRRGHTVYVERGAGAGAGFADKEYQAVGAQLALSPEEVWRRAQVVVKVGRPTAAEHEDFQGQTLVSFLHLAVASPDLRAAPLPRGADEAAGGRGILLSGIPGIPPANVVILGAGVVGSNAARAFVGLGTEVTALDQDIRRLERLDERFPGRVVTMLATPYNIEKAVGYADVLIGAVYVSGQRAPLLVTRAMVRKMHARAVIIDFAIDQGGGVEPSRPTPHRDPIYVADDVIHYCVPNVPARVARTASHAWSNAVLPYVTAIADLGVDEAIRASAPLRRGVAMHGGEPLDAEMA